MEISFDRFKPVNPGRTLVFVGLNPTNANLIVRQSTTDVDNQINNADTTVSDDGNRYPLDSLINTYNSDTTGRFTGAANKSSNRCDIVNGIEYQRWVLIGVVGNGRVLDVYIDGKLARSCAYTAPNSLGSPNGIATAYFGLGNEGNLKGYFSNGMFYNYALTPANIWGIYQDGPAGPFNIYKWATGLFNPTPAVTTSAPK